MKQLCKYALRSYMSSRLAQARKNAGLSQAAFSTKLMMDIRSYAEIEHGKSFCSALTFILYLVFFCDDVENLIKDLRQIITDACNEERSA